VLVYLVPDKSLTVYLNDYYVYYDYYYYCTGLIEASIDIIDKAILKLLSHSWLMLFLYALIQSF